MTQSGLTYPSLIYNIGPMIKRMFVVLILVAFTFPMFVSLGSHDFKHAMHVVYEAHSTEETHEHTAHNHSESETQPQHHPINISFASYFQDHLYPGFQISSNKKNRFEKNAQRMLVDNYVVILSETYPESMLPVKQMEPGILPRNDLYQKTQRLRIDV